MKIIKYICIICALLLLVISAPLCSFYGGSVGSPFVGVSLVLFFISVLIDFD